MGTNLQFRSTNMSGAACGCAGRCLGMRMKESAHNSAATFPAGAEIRKRHKPHQRQPVAEMSYILQVPVPFFFEGAPEIAGYSGKGAEVASPAYVSDFSQTPTDWNWSRGFTQIGDAKLRRCLVRLVEEIVGEGDNGRWDAKFTSRILHGLAV